MTLIRVLVAAAINLVIASAADAGVLIVGDNGLVGSALQDTKAKLDSLVRTPVCAGV